jgi:hypothetical protein
MFIEVYARIVDIYFTINVRAIAFFYPLDDGTRIYFINDATPLDVYESYNELKEQVKKASSEYKEV